MTRKRWIRIGLFLLLDAAVIAAVVLVLLQSTANPPRDDVPNELLYDEESIEASTTQATPRYEQVQEFPAMMNAPVGLTVAGDEVHVVGESNWNTFQINGRPIAQRTLDAKNLTCVAPDGQQGMLAGAGNRVLRLQPDGKSETILTLNDKAEITCLARNERYLFVADAGNRVVWRMDRTTGKNVPLGKPEDTTGGPGFIIPSPQFDLLIDDANLLRVVNPGRLHVEAYTVEGWYEEPLTWGQAGNRVQDFVGCCNPTNLIQLPDGRFVTSEKGIPRVKVYSHEGEFVCLAAGPKSFDDKQGPADLACDARGRIFVLDPVRKTVRIFAEKKP